MLNSGGYRIENLTSRIARNVVGGTVAHKEEDRRLWRGICNAMVVKCLTWHTAFQQANGAPFDLRKIYVSGVKRQAFGW